MGNSDNNFARKEESQNFGKLLAKLFQLLLIYALINWIILYQILLFLCVRTFFFDLSFFTIFAPSTIVKYYTARIKREKLYTSTGARRIWTSFTIQYNSTPYYEENIKTSYTQERSKLCVAQCQQYILMYITSMRLKCLWSHNFCLHLC